MPGAQIPPPDHILPLDHFAPAEKPQNPHESSLSITCSLRAARGWPAPPSHQGGGVPGLPGQEAAPCGCKCPKRADATSVLRSTT